jgi:hypothetical protein
MRSIWVRSSILAAHSVSEAAQLGSTSPTNGDSLISFWYLVHCPDTVTYDWATALLNDTTAGTTSTILGKICTNSGAWQEVTAGVTASHAYTLPLTSHDDT